PENPSKCSKARGSDLRVHYKNTRETAMAIRGKTLIAAKQHLGAVLERKRCIPHPLWPHWPGQAGEHA
ncbi:hypothetical protein HC023_27390, partial [Streptomyces sp. NEAU-H3]|nr:hypothetical protein [Streptomyces sp. NEAU-H3]